MAKKKNESVVNENQMLAVITDPTTKRQMLNVPALPVDVRQKVSKIVSDLTNAMKQAAVGQLMMGKYFLEAKNLLDPLSYFLPFINTFPGISKATAYRYIGRYEIACKHLPPAVRQYALTDGIDIAGTTEEAPYGKYTAAVKKVGPPPAATGNKQEDESAAQVWIAEVTNTQAKDFHKNTRGKKTYHDLVKGAVKAVCDRFRVLPEDAQQTTFIRDVFGYTLANVAMTSITVNPKTPASDDLKFDVKPSKKGRKKNGKKGQEKEETVIDSREVVRGGKAKGAQRTVAHTA